VSLKRTVGLWALAWTVVVGGLHAWLNLDLSREGGTAREGFRVGFLPVT